MRNPPPAVVSSWPKPNYVNPERQGPSSIIVGAIFLSISFLVVGLRMFVRLHMKKTAGWDDWLMLVNLPLLACHTSVLIVGTYFGWGYHIWDNKPQWIRGSRVTTWVSQLCSVLIMTFVKLSILASYLRISKTAKSLRYATWVMIGVITAWGVAFAFSLFFACVPLRHYWDHFSDHHCSNEAGRIMTTSISNLVSDVLVLALPIPTFCKMHLPIREKVILIILMNLILMYEYLHYEYLHYPVLAFFFACAASIVRAYYTYVVVARTYDVTWIGYKVWLWSSLEGNLLVICASVPTLRPFARKYFPRLGFKSVDGTSQENSAAQAPALQRSPSQSRHSSEKDEESSLEDLAQQYLRTTVE
ncbi:hypothetical protein LOY89_000469 [Ophidiomyces ophidiicola]|uniref:Uncharacterized protein n=1 Tax=Ophidiomyces ophidiicola TaxID=1387563 RepID=A0ACB8V5F4_9EURO|nr:uncharacterized protein LOZ57_003092 [Ophidiomyces ophidiicola]KAI1923664.1 hypothetical protein LOZ64_000923 [Ophidiomyces ophidiicola]KAI1947940.1 hypothetical protein LOZ57_003092 [Ophidiomyces ophidiicola]KAI1967767.1 hypothetical protein LOZ59_000582 [Ophidiomyces ophidiicola]KAI2034029.1 hypothetical protein LOZ45_000650 [Ophidiomyces ophidiicola]KAI2034267.1 hypothetical protein LOZ48_001767 [Ophidiomyces ophidiicola]